MADPRVPPARAASLGGAALTFAVALAARLAMVRWAAAAPIPPIADGRFYHIIADRISQGLGYTWLWDDGAVTYAAHYPIGYPALAGAVYAAAGPRPVAAMLLNAVLGAVAAVAAHRLAARAAGPRVALVSGLAVALHPGLVAYTPALMTEGVTAALVTVAAAVAAWARDRRSVVLPAIALGVVVGVATLVRPQSLVLATLFGLLAALTPPAPLSRSAGEGGDASSVSPSPAERERGPGGEGPREGAAARSTWLRPLKAAAVATLAALLVCAPWTARNCARMHHCALVSVNGGWNLLIGADAESTGAWSPIHVPDACRTVFDEAQKDVCFGREARRYIREHPAEWLALVPRKLAATFDYAGAAPWYLHDANPRAFPYAAKEKLGALETLYERVALLLCLGWTVRRAWEEARPTALGVAFIGAFFVLSLHAWQAYLALAAALLLRGRSLWTGPVLAGAAALALAATLVTHAVFFGSGRYSLVVFPLITALAPLALRRRATYAP